MKTIKITPRGYCHGVVSAIQTILKLDYEQYPKPITVLGMVIHNKQVMDAFKARGIKYVHNPKKTRLELLDSIDSGTVIFTAHGVSEEVFNSAKKKGLTIIDTTCEDVVASHNIIKEYLNKGYEILYIGKKYHPESEAAISFDEDVHLVEKVDDLYNISFNKPLAITNQTTMSLFDVYQITEEAMKQFDNITFIDEICDSTRMRQTAVANQDSSIDHCFIVGDKLSNNSNKLVQVSIDQAHVDASLIESVEDIDIERLKSYKTVSLTSGASTPTSITTEVYRFLRQFDPLDESTHNNSSKITKHNLFPNNQ